ncbi:hypothetical protein DXG01_012366 [Tephrocybe rancida]|nr:hypothetical protein DXG01_012366 [Tephrocybe rancida]
MAKSSTSDESPSQPDINKGPVNKSFFRSTLCQILLIGWNAMNSLGAGGALEPYLVNAANSIIFALMGLLCIMSALIVNRIGVRYTLLLGTLGWAPYSAALYQNNRYGTEWFVIFAAVLDGISAGMYWAAEGAIVLSYPEHAKRGRYLAIWSAFKNSGQIVGGAITLGLNAHNSVGGKVSYATLLAFAILQVLPLPFAIAISDPEKVQREDGTKVKVDTATSTTEQLRILARAVTSKKLGFLLPIFFNASEIPRLFRYGLLLWYLNLGINHPTSIHNHASWEARLVKSWVWAWIRDVHHVDDGGSHGSELPRMAYAHLLLSESDIANSQYWAVGSLGDGTSELTRSAGLLRGVEAWGQCVAFGINSSYVNIKITSASDGPF